MQKRLNQAINVAKVLTSAISSRDVAEKLKPFILTADTESVDLDFQAVKFISRSVAHELLTMKEDLTKKKQVLFVNLAKEVREMLRVTAANRVAPAHEAPQFNPIRTTIKDLINEVALV